MKRTRHLKLLACCLLLAATHATPALSAVDTFYLERLDSGVRAQQAGDHPTAVRQLRIAAFGLLDEPDRLTETLCRLGISQSALRDGDAFRETFQRVMEVEQRFPGAYSARLPLELRAAFEEAVPRHIPEEELARLPLFAELAERRAELRLAGLPPRQRARELEARLRADPDNPARLLALGRLHLEDGRYRRARPYLDRALAIDPDDREALCLRGRGAAEANDCPTAAADLPRCPAAAAEPDLAADLLRCLVRLERWQPAGDFLLDLDPAVRVAPQVARHETRVAGELPPGALEGAAASTDPAGQQDAAATGSQAPPTSPEPAAGNPPSPIPAPSQAEELERIRRRAAAAAGREALLGELEEARRLADGPQTSSEARILAGELAYRLADWQLARGYLSGAGAALDRRPLLQFYLAVALYETGELEEAQARLRRALPFLARTDLVETYETRILGEAPSR